jgi:hypothetical protein
MAKQQEFFSVIVPDSEDGKLKHTPLEGLAAGDAFRATAVAMGSAFEPGGRHNLAAAAWRARLTVRAAGSTQDVVAAWVDSDGPSMARLDLVLREGDTLAAVFRQVRMTRIENQWQYSRFSAAETTCVSELHVTGYVTRAPTPAAAADASLGADEDDEDDDEEAAALFDEARQRAGGGGH